MTPRPCNAAKDSSLCAVASDLSVTLDHVMLQRVVVMLHPRHEDGMSRNLDIVALTSIDSGIAQTILPSEQTPVSYLPRRHGRQQVVERGGPGHHQQLA